MKLENESGSYLWGWGKEQMGHPLKAPVMIYLYVE
jgi:hypothetical protein